MPIERVEAGVDAPTLSGIVEVAWETLFGDGLTALDGAPVIAAPICSSIAIGGPWSATVIMAVDAGAAYAAASSLLGSAVDDLDEADVLDLLGEVANIVGGNLKGVVSGAGDGEWTLSLPVVSTGAQTVPGSRCVLALGFATGHGLLACEVREHA